MIRSGPLLALAVFGAALPGAGFAQQKAPVAVAREASAALTPAQRAAAVADIQKKVTAHYVFPERAPAIVARLSEGLASGRYDTPDAGAFAERLTTDLRESSGDRHMYINHAPAEYEATLAAKGERKDTTALDALRQREAARANHGLAEMTILPGNVRYLKITGFQWVEDQTGGAYDAAMRFLRGGDAVVIDLRGNGGGSHAAVRYLLSHFMDGDQLDITFRQAGEEPVQSRTLEYLPAGRLKGKPLYVLIDGGVGSAAEAFAYDVQQFKLGALVGARTAGAANNNEFYPIAPGFMLSVSFGRPVHPVSQSNWEAVGVSPDVAVDGAKALDVALSLALASLAERMDADPADRADWAWARQAVEARLHPVTIAPARLKAWAGAYSGRTVAFQNGGLFWKRKSGEMARLIPLTADGLFTVDGYDDHLRIRLTGDALELQWIDEPAPTRLPRD